MPLSKPQKEVITNTSRFRVLITGRRFGKTYLAINELAKFARYSNKKVWYVAPSYRQAKSICWNVLKSKSSFACSISSFDTCSPSKVVYLNDCQSLLVSPNL